MTRVTQIPEKPRFYSLQSKIDSSFQELQVVNLKRCFVFLQKAERDNFLHSLSAERCFCRNIIFLQVWSSLYSSILRQSGCRKSYFCGKNLSLQKDRKSISYQKVFLPKFSATERPFRLTTESYHVNCGDLQVATDWFRILTYLDTSLPRNRRRGLARWGRSSWAAMRSRPSSGPQSGGGRGFWVVIQWCREISRQYFQLLNLLQVQ